MAANLDYDENAWRDLDKAELSQPEINILGRLRYFTRLKANVLGCSIWHPSTPTLNNPGRAGVLRKGERDSFA